MKKTIPILLIIPVIVGVFFTSCVTSKKYMASEANVSKLQLDSTRTHRQLGECSDQVSNLTIEKATLLNENASMQNDFMALNTQSKMTIADQTKRLKALQGMIQSQNDVMTKLKNSMTDALVNYKSDEMNVYIKNGNVYVSLEEKLLFKSGSDVVDAKGKEALKSLAKVLNNTDDINVMIEGHTDNVPIKNKIFVDNWALSTARATSIVRILTKDDGFDPKRITASGNSQFHPVNSNDTAAGRANNRRTLVILSPDLKELYTLLQM
jgi:chemotaxis protein MotB